MLLLVVTINTEICEMFKKAAASNAKSPAICGGIIEDNMVQALRYCIRTSITIFEGALTILQLLVVLLEDFLLQLVCDFARLDPLRCLL